MADMQLLVSLTTDKYEEEILFANYSYIERQHLSIK